MFTEGAGNKLLFIGAEGEGAGANPTFGTFGLFAVPSALFMFAARLLISTKKYENQASDKPPKFQEVFVAPGLQIQVH